MAAVEKVNSKTFITQRAKVGFNDYSRGSGGGGGGQKAETQDVFQDASPSQTSQSTLLLHKKKQMEEAQLELDRKKEEIRLRMLRCQEQEDKLAIQQSDLRAQVVKFEKFLKDNDAKRLRMHKKALDEIRQRVLKEEEILRLKDQLGDIEFKKLHKKEQLQKLRVYEEYLELVVQHSDDFTDVVDLTNRYETLANANTELKKSIDQGNQEMKEQSTQLSTFIKDAQNQILLSNSSIAEHQQDLEIAKLESAKATQERETEQKRRKEETRLSGEIAMSIENLYQRCKPGRGAKGEAKGSSGAMSHKPKPSSSKHANVSSSVETLRARLLVIEEKLCDLQDVIGRAREAMAKEREYAGRES